MAAPRDKRLRDWILGGMGSGFSPVMPGTMGSLVTAIPLAFVPIRPLGYVVCIAVCVVASLLTILLATGFTDSGHADSKHGDPGWVVLDEVAGQALAMVGAVFFVSRGVTTIWVATAVAFALFRFFDITKLGPVRVAEGAPGAWGILLDDLVAGAIAAGLMVLGGFAA